MKNLDVEYTWAGSTESLYFEIPNSATDLQVQTAISTALSVYEGSNYLALRHKIGTTTPWNYSDLILNTTNKSQIKSAINSAVTIIGGRSRRG